MAVNEIIQLPDSIADKIAAGEVIERPYNIVKELLENSVDAYAVRITIEIEDGGLSLIKVTDNGKGILPEDLPLTIQRYATSKIRHFEDIYSIKTFGFRGEALAAISSVCDFSIASRREPFDGYILIKNFNSEPIIKPSNIPKGTIVEVKNLFSKIPVRKKFLKSSSSEFKEIIKFIKSFAAINYKIDISCTKDGIKVFESLKKDSMLERVMDIFGETACFPINYSDGNISIDAVLGRPDNQKFRKDYIIISVNNRIVKDYSITQAILQAYSRLIPENRFPLAFINIQISDDTLDVNIHPTKTTVRFMQPQQIFNVVYNSIKNSLNNLKLETKDAISIDDFPIRDFNEEQYKPVFDITNYAEINDNKIEEPVTEYNTSNEFTVVGQLFKTVILCEKGDELYFIDQHIAHERVLYELYTTGEKLPPSFVLFEPILLTLELDEIEFLDKNRLILRKFGFEFELFSKDSIKITAIPSSIMQKDIENEIKKLIAELMENSNKNNDGLALTMSCRNAVKSGDYLTKFEMEELVRNLFKTSNPYTCPHGRPIIFKITKDFIYNKFQR
ncbi:MAG: DNA mismatch repair endonuclease MutL [Deferribacterales bacterium]